MCLRTACLQIAWLMVLFYLQDLLQASGRLLTVPGNLDITVHAWFMSQKAAIASVSRQLSWLLPGFLISTTIVVFKARKSVGDAGGGLSGADAMVAVPTAHAPVSAPLPDRWLDQDFYSIKYKFLSNPLYKVFSLGSLEEPAAFRGWLKRIAVNLARDVARSRIRRGELGEAAAPEGRDELIEIQPASGDPSASQKVRLAETRREIVEAIAGLPEEYAQVAAMRYLENLDYGEMERRLRINREALRKRLHRANLMLRKALRRTFPEFAEE